MQYTESDNIIANPERGFYKHTEVHTGSYGNLNAETLSGYRTNQSITQILRVFYLEAFRDRPITEDYLANMQIDFAAARQAGVKVIVRFAYSQGTGQPYNDAQPEVVFMHIQQLKDVLRQNADVIAVMQAGFVGTWGEWYYTEGFAGNGPSDISQQNYADRAKVISEILSALPKDRMVQIRTPGYKMRMFDTQEPITASDAQSGINRARVGHHNDCFVASSSDFGTYRDQDLEKPFLEAETTYLPMGGETCALAPPYSDCDNSQNELERFHWSYLNIDYNRTVLDEWRSQGCFDEVELRLGYRYVMNKANITNRTNSKSSFTLDLELINKGYASTYNPRDVEVILKNIDTQEEYSYKTDEDPRFWPIGSNFSIKLTSGLPEGITEGHYKVFLKMGDPYPTIANNPSYSIQMANENVWDPELGYNDLNIQLTVSDTVNAETYMGDNYFKLVDVETTEALPTKMYAGSSSTERLLFWGAQEGFIRIVERSINGSDFEVLKTLDGNSKYYKDSEYIEGANYSYRFKLQNNVLESTYSNIVSLTNAESDFITIITNDGTDTDWKNVSSLISAVNDDQETLVVRMFFDVSNVNFILYGSVTDYNIYLNTDNLKETGWLSSDQMEGMDYLIQNDKVFHLNNKEKTEKLTIESFTKTDSTIEFSFDHSTFENMGSNPTIGLFALLNGAEELGVDVNGGAESFFRQPSPDLPDTLYTENPINDKTSIELLWSACKFCDNYEIERSIDGISFELVAEPDYTVINLIDRGLTIDQKYYYRMRTVNTLGISDYTATISSVAGKNPLLGAYLGDIMTIFPNPSENWIYLSEQLAEVEIVDLTGKSHLKVRKSKISAIDITGLPSGVYLLKGNNENHRWVGRFVKN